MGLVGKSKRLKSNKTPPFKPVKAGLESTNSASEATVERKKQFFSRMTG